MLNSWWVGKKLGKSYKINPRRDPLETPLNRLFLGARKSVKEGHKETNLITEPHDTAQSFSFYRIASLHARACQPVKLRTANCVKRRQPVIIARQAGQTKSAVKVIIDNQTVKEEVPQHYICASHKVQC